MKNEKNEKVYIQMFSHFRMEGLGGVLDEDNIRSEMLNKLLAYMVCHQTKEISTAELIDVLWYDEESDNPAGALKNLVYRLRTILKKQWPDMEFIITGRGSYKWNAEVPAVTDVQEFEKYCEAASKERTADRKIEAYLQAVSFYKGTFLTKFLSEYWVASLSTYYHSMYLSAVKSASRLLEQEERYEEMGQICGNAVCLDELDEDLQCNFIRSLLYQKKMKLAMEQYKKAENILYEKLGVSPSKELREVYNELLKQTNEEERSMKAIQRILSDDSDRGAFLCDYGVFKKIYHLEKRRVERLGISVYLSVITVVPDAAAARESEAYLNLVQKGMERLEYALTHSLRSGDVISKYSGSQYVVLLPSCQYESAKMVMQRVESTFYAEDKKKLKVTLHYDLDEMDDR